MVVSSTWHSLLLIYSETRTSVTCLLICLKFLHTKQPNLLEEGSWPTYSCISHNTIQWSPYSMGKNAIITKAYRNWKWNSGNTHLLSFNETIHAWYQVTNTRPQWYYVKWLPSHQKPKWVLRSFLIWLVSDFCPMHCLTKGVRPETDIIM